MMLAFKKIGFAASFTNEGNLLNCFRERMRYPERRRAWLMGNGYAARRRNIEPIQWAIFASDSD